MAQLVCRLHLLAHTAFELKPATVLDLFEQLDALRRPERVHQFLLACEADKRGRLGLERQDYPQAAYLVELFRKAREPSAQPLLDSGLQGEALGAELRAARLRAITQARKAYLDGQRKNPA